jgi:hypothetical protein
VRGQHLQTTQAGAAYLVERRLCLLLRLSAALVKGAHGGVELGDGAVCIGQQREQAQGPWVCATKVPVQQEAEGTYADMFAARGTSSQTACRWCPPSAAAESSCTRARGGDGGSGEGSAERRTRWSWEPCRGAKTIVGQAVRQRLRRAALGVGTASSCRRLAVRT